jgi:HAD superfamily phosphoserine phosphatase-like hydrolase
MLVLKNSIGLMSMGLKYIFGLMSKEAVKRTSFKMFFSNYNTKKDIKNFVDKIPWNNKIKDIVDAKKREGYKVILVSASPDVYLPYICDYLGYDGFLATKTLRDGDNLAGLFDGAVCNHEEKTRRIKEYLGDNEPSHTLSYGNSVGDYPMLRFCDESYFVKKSDIKKFQE